MKGRGTDFECSLAWAEVEIGLIPLALFLVLEEDVIALSRYVEFAQPNLDSYSIEMARLLMGATQELDVILKQLCARHADTSTSEADPPPRVHGREDKRRLSPGYLLLPSRRLSPRPLRPRRLHFVPASHQGRPPHQGSARGLPGEGRSRPGAFLYESPARNSSVSPPPVRRRFGFRRLASERDRYCPIVNWSRTSRESAKMPPAAARFGMDRGWGCVGFPW
jgi:hypothetical protein